MPRISNKFPIIILCLDLVDTVFVFYKITGYYFYKLYTNSHNDYMSPELINLVKMYKVDIIDKFQTK